MSKPGESREEIITECANLVNAIRDQLGIMFRELFEDLDTQGIKRILSGEEITESTLNKLRDRLQKAVIAAGTVSEGISPLYDSYEQGIPIKKSVGDE